MSEPSPADFAVLRDPSDYDAPKNMKPNIGWNQRYKTVTDRFFEKVVGIDDNTGCWLLAGKGYGRFWNGEKLVRTHRFVFEHFVAPLRLGEGACHECDNPRCVNPGHLFPGSQQINMQDCIAKGRGNKRRGEGVHTAKLSEYDVRKIREEFVPRKFGKYRLAKRWNMSPSAISSILSRETWAHVE